MAAAVAYLELEGKEAIGRGLGQDDALELAIEGHVLPGGLERDEELLGAGRGTSPQGPDEGRRHRYGAIDGDDGIELLGVGPDGPLVDKRQAEGILDTEAHVIAVALGSNGEELDALATLVMNDGGFDQNAARPSVEGIARVGEIHLEFVEDGLGPYAALGEHDSGSVDGATHYKIDAALGIAVAHGIEEAGDSVSAPGEGQAKQVALFAKEEKGGDEAAFARGIWAVKHRDLGVVEFCPFGKPRENCGPRISSSPCGGDVGVYRGAIIGSKILESEPEAT